MIAYSGQHETTPKMFCCASLVSVRPALPFLFRTYAYGPDRKSRYPGSCRMPVDQALRASCAAPTYFEEFVHYVDSEEGDEVEVYLDGGLLCNNPTQVMLHECRCIFPDRPIGCVVSLGTGDEPPEELELQHTAGSWASLLGGLVSTMARTDLVDDAMRDWFPPDTYFRLNPVLSYRTELNEYRHSKLVKLQEDSRQYLATTDGQGRLAAMCGRLAELEAFGTGADHGTSLVRLPRLPSDTMAGAEFVRSNKCQPKAPFSAKL